MKPSFDSLSQKFGMVAVAAITVLSLTSTGLAKDKDKDKDKDRGPPGKGPPSFFNRGPDRGPDRRDDRGPGRRDDDDRRRRFFAAPRSTFVVTLGDGYAGRGYYYGPPNSSYFYKGDGIVYYSRRESVPVRYWGHPGPSSNIGSADAAVQRALAKRGYYNGPIDGDIGPGTRASIARYQRDRGLPVTGTINSTLLRSLGL